MSDFTENLKTQLETQLSELATQIRTAENNLLSLKETYLKVSGGLEILTVVNNKEIEETREAMISAGVAD